MEAEPSTVFEPINKPCPIQVPNTDDDPNKPDPMKESPVVGDADTAVRNFDLNADVVAAENQEVGPTVTATENAAASVEPPPESKNEELLSEVDGMAIDPHQIAQFNSRIDEDEDYDEE
uniref:Uncharacterized protein n=3 Tax=Chenopodium quinoa TaxID=63459 RepID=A0A803ML71_CHEQI